MKFFPKLARSIRKRTRPTAKEKAMRSYLKDGGDEALRYSFDLNERSLVLDFGGFEGEWSERIFERYGCQIEIFEPVKAFCENIEEKFSENSQVRVHQYALGGESRSEQISLDGDASSTLLNSEANGETIQLVDVREWFKKHEIGRVDLVKMNIEGGEYELLEAMIDSGLISGIDRLQVQFHDLAPDSEQRMQTIRQKLAETHDPVFHYFFVWDCWKRKAV